MVSGGGNRRGPRGAELLHSPRLNKSTAFSDAERFTYPSVDGREIEGWIMKPFGYQAGKKYPLVIFLVVLAVFGYLLHFTVFGRYVFAIGGNRDAAQYSGIHVDRVELATYVISAGLAGVAGVCYASYIGQMSQSVGVAYELYAITAAVLGGCSLRGGEGTIIGIIITIFWVLVDAFLIPGWVRQQNNLLATQLGA